jgi:serine/threonine protein kinase
VVTLRATLLVEEGTALRTMVGTPQYLAPEIVMQTRAQPGYENVVDSWSVGVIVYSNIDDAVRRKSRRVATGPFYSEVAARSETDVMTLSLVLDTSPETFHGGLRPRTTRGTWDWFDW